MVSEVQNKCRILVVQNHAEASAGLPEELGALGHDVVATCARDEALARTDFDQFDLIVSDLDDHESSRAEVVEAFKLGAASTIPLRRVGQPEDIANVIAFLCSDESSFVSGQTIYVRGGP